MGILEPLRGYPGLPSNSAVDVYCLSTVRAPIS